MTAPRFIRIVERESWDVELVGTAKRQSFESREEALRFALRNEPEWIEIGAETLRRRSDGSYKAMGQPWQGPKPEAEAGDGGEA